MRRQRLQALCGRWQSGLLERQCNLLLPVAESSGHAPMQGALLFTLAWLQFILAGPLRNADPADAPLDAASLSERKSSLEALCMSLMNLLEL